MKQEIITALNAKFSGVSERIIGRVADKLISSGKVKKSEDVEEAVKEVTFQQILDQYGDYRANEAAQTAKRNYEKDHNLKDGKPGVDGSNEQQPGADDKKTNGDEAPPWAKTLIERVERIEVAKTVESRKQQLTNVIAKLPEALRKPYERLSLDQYSDEEFTKALADITTEVEGIANSAAARGGVFGKPSAAGSPADKAELSKEQLAAIAHRDGSRSADEQPF